MSEGGAIVALMELADERRRLALAAEGFGEIVTVRGLDGDEITELFHWLEDWVLHEDYRPRQDCCMNALGSLGAVYTITIYFRHVKDAVYFKLRWYDGRNTP